MRKLTVSVLCAVGLVSRVAGCRTNGNGPANRATPPLRPATAAASTTAASVSAWRQRRAPTIHLHFTAERYTLPSGMTVLLRRDPSVPRGRLAVVFRGLSR